MLVKNKNPAFSYFSLYKYGTCTEVALVWVSVLLTVLASFVLLWIIVEYGEMASMMQLRPLGQTTPRTVMLSLFGGGRIIYNGTLSEHTAALGEDLVAHAWAALAQFLIGTTFSTLAATIMNITAVRQANRIRRMFFESALRQDQAFFDTDNSLNVATTMNDNINKIQGGIAEKVTLFVYLMSTGLIGAIFSFFFGWKLALACLTVLPFAVFSAFWVSRYQSQSAEKEQQSYSKAGRLAEATIAGIKTVTAFDGGQTEVDRFTVCLTPAVKSGIRRAFVTGVGMGINWLLTFSLICIGFMYGTRLAYDDQFLSLNERSYYSGSVIIIIYNVFTSVQNIALSSTQTELFSKACGAAKDVFQLISTQPNIDSLRDSGIKPSSFRGEIKLENVHFSYPARPTVQVLKGISLHIRPGETVALVGSSGCGKSTILQLVQRLYDPASGDVFIDKENIKNYNLSWLRGHTGVVGQEPVLFSGTIRENISLGKPDASFEEIENAAKIANAHDFICKLANGYNTYIGERGASLSGGQKQRIAIARSMIRDPPLLLLDEATSALDPASEKRVQVALDKASAGRTTLVISHRLSTIVNASRIICMDQGVIVEEGTHAELLNKKGAYWKLVHTDGDAKQEIIEEETGEETTECPSVASPVTPMDSATLHYPRRRSSSMIKTSEISGVAGIQTFPVKPITRLSLTYDAEEEIDEESNGEITEKEKPISIWKILSLSLPEWPWLLVGTLASLIQGATWPVFNVLMEKLLRVFNELQTPNILSDADLYSALYLVVAFCSGVGMFLAGVTYTTAGLKLTKRLRIRTFTSYVNNEIGFFDQPKNSVGVLCARLSEDAAAVQGGVGTCISVVVMSMASFVLCLAVSFAYNWKLSLFAMVFVPMIGGIQWYDTHKVMSTEKKLRNATESATKIATESLIAIKTVQSLGLEKLMLRKFDSALDKATQASIDALRFRGLVFGLGQFLPMISFNYSLVYGAYLVANEGVSYSSAFFVIQNSFSVGYALGQALMYVPDFRSAAISATRIIKILERKPLIQTDDSVKENSDWVASGEFGFHNLHFSYPTRPHQKVLNGLSLRVEPRKKVALVGYSGCGKSTCLQLMQRFYDPATGNIELDGRDIRRALSLPQLRRQLGVVQQEPTLFERTIAENIAYGDNSRTVAMDKIITAAKQANIHAFIASLPKGYETVLGSGGAQLSGGQKQRICIARALLRAPRLLLLDEATSALDSRSQKVVSEALESAAEGRTCVTIAHRLSTIQRADIICVLHKGEIVEKGTHEELIALKGYYRKMHLLQSTETT